MMSSSGSALSGAPLHRRTEFVLFFVWKEPTPSDALRGEDAPAKPGAPGSPGGPGGPGGPKSPGGPGGPVAPGGPAGPAPAGGSS
jgi:hypothetical protein